MPASVAMPAVRQNRSKLAPTCDQASSTIAAGKSPAGVVDLFMALLSFEDSAPRAYRLQVGNAYLTFSTSVGTSPQRGPKLDTTCTRDGGERASNALAGLLCRRGCLRLAGTKGILLSPDPIRRLHSRRRRFVRWP